jgi:hypothetical protein
MLAATSAEPLGLAMRGSALMLFPGLELASNAAGSSRKMQ